MEDGDHNSNVIYLATWRPPLLVPATLRDFARLVASGDLPTASQVLERLMDLDRTQAAGATSVFAVELAADAAAITRVMALREAVRVGDRRGAMTLLMSCFRMEGIVAANALIKLAADPG